MTNLRQVFLCTALVAGAFVAGFSIAGSSPAEALVSGAPAAHAPAPLVTGLPDFTGLVEHNKGSVVSISVEMAKPSARGNMQGEMPEMLKRFFGDQFNFEMPDPQQRGAPQSLGSGFIISADGYILSNNHVVAKAERVMVRLLDRRELEAKVIGTDPRSDIALLKVDAKDLPVVKIGSSQALKVGEWVFAIGAPFGFDYSVTAGIVSALGRGLPRENYVPFIQTDVAINPGNSGGPLFNLAGEVVGINSQIFSGSGGYMGLSFAIPMDIAMEVVDQLKSGGKVKRGWLGVVIQDVDRDLAESFGLARPEGALVSKVMPEGPAAASDLKEGDIITALDGKPVVFSSDLPHLVGRVKAGTKVTLTVMRGGKPRDIKVTIGELPSEDALAGNEQPDSPATGAEPATAPAAGRLGLAVEAVPEARRKQAGGKGGVIVTRVLGEPATATELRAGDVIVAVNSREVGSVSEFNAAIEKLPAGKLVPLLVDRAGSPMFVAIRLK